MQRPRRSAGHRRPHLGPLVLRLVLGGRGGLLQPLRQSVEGRHPSSARAGHRSQQHLPVGGERHEPGVAGQLRHTAPGMPDPRPPCVVAADPVPEDGHQELAVGIAKTAPPRGIQCFRGRAVRRGDSPRDPPAGLRREEAARAHLLDDRESGTYEEVVEFLSVLHAIMIPVGSQGDKVLSPGPTGALTRVEGETTKCGSRSDGTRGGGSAAGWLPA